MKRYIEDNLCKELNLMMVEVPLIVDVESGVNDMLDRDGSRTPIQFHISNDRNLHPIDAQVVQAATKWKRVALKQFDCKVGEGICTDMRAVRKDYFLDHDHSAYVDQWDWERVITTEQRNLEFLKEIVGRIWKVMVGRGEVRAVAVPAVEDPRYPNLPEKLPFCMPRKFWICIPTCRASSARPRFCKKYPAVFIIGIGWPLKDGYPHEMRAADYDDWVTDTRNQTGKDTHGLNGDILVWNPVTKRRHELTSMGIRVTAETLKQQLTMSKQLDFMQFPYHKAILNNQIPLSIGGGIGQSRTLMLLLRKAHLGEVSVTVWPKVLKEMCAGGFCFCTGQEYLCTGVNVGCPTHSRFFEMSVCAVAVSLMNALSCAQPSVAKSRSSTVPEFPRFFRLLQRLLPQCAGHLPLVIGKCRDLCGNKVLALDYVG